MLEILAGRLAVELERHVLLREVAHAAEVKRQAEQTAQWHQDRSHLVPPWVEGWQFSAKALARPAVHGDFHFWRMTADDQLLLATGGMQGASRQSSPLSGVAPRCSASSSPARQRPWTCAGAVK